MGFKKRVKALDSKNSFESVIDPAIASVIASARVNTRPHVVDELVAEALEPEFARLRRSNDPARRGFEFELLLLKLFRLDGYVADRNPKVARPRQTDLLARKDKQLYVVEAKWQREEIGIAEIDSLQSRLQRAPRGAIACLFSMSLFTESAASRVEQLRSAESGGCEMLLFGPSEVSLLLEGRLRLEDTVITKLQHLREVGANLWLTSEPEDLLAPLDIPAARLDIRRAERSNAPQEGRAYHFAFGETPASFDFFGAKDRGHQLDTGTISVSSRRELAGLFDLLHSHLRFSGSGGYTITQLGADRIWFGLGTQELLADLERLEKRNRRASVANPHHSEEFSFYDTTRYGALYVSGRHRVSDGQLYGVSAELRLAGIPLDLGPLRAIMERLRGTVVLSPIEETFVEYVEVGGKVLVKPLEYLQVGTMPDYFGGAVVENPFWNGDSLNRGDVPEALSSTSFLVGRLGDWLHRTERVRMFWIRSVKLIKFRRGTVFDVFLAHDKSLRTSTIQDG